MTRLWFRAYPMVLRFQVMAIFDMMFALLVRGFGLSGRSPSRHLFAGFLRTGGQLAPLGNLLGGVLERCKPFEGRLDDVDRIGATPRLGQYVFDARQLDHRSDGAAGDHACARGGRLQHHG